MAIGNFSFEKTGKEIADSLLQGGINRRRAEEELFKQYNYFIKEGIRKYALTEDESFDAYSDTILVAIENIMAGSFQNRSSIKTWLFQIYHNKCVDLIRKKTTNKYSVHNTRCVTDMLHNLSDSAKGIVQQLAEKTDWETLIKKLNELGENCRLLLMYWAEGLSDKQIASSMTYKSADVVKTSRLRCLEKLRQSYKFNQ
ncbi:MAG TPA: RNA polymerase sigma factor [Niastella sp.]